MTGTGLALAVVVCNCNVPISVRWCEEKGLEEDGVVAQSSTIPAKWKNSDYLPMVKPGACSELEIRPGQVTLCAGRGLSSLKSEWLRSPDGVKQAECVNTGY